MFYSVELLRKRVGKNGRIPACFIAATSKIFVGSGSHKLSKKDIKNINIAAACGDIINGITGAEGVPRFSLYLSSQLAFGAVKIYEEQCKILEEEFRKLCTELITFGTKTKSKKSSKKTKDMNKILNDDLPEQGDINIMLRDDQVDSNLLPEKDFTLHVDLNLEFGDINYDKDSFACENRFPPPPPPEIVPISNNEQEESNRISFLPEDFPSEHSLSKTDPGTPKRKSRQLHTGTPSKRKRIPDNPSELARTSATPPMADRASSFRMAADLGVSGNLPSDRSSGLPIASNEDGTTELQIDNAHFVPMRSTPPINMDVSYAQPVIEDNSYDISKGPRLAPMSVLHSSDPSKQYSVIEDNMVEQTIPLDAHSELILEELNETPIVSLRGRNKSKQKPVFDEQTKLSSFNPSVTVCTKRHFSALVSIRKMVSATELMALPSTGCKLEIKLNLSCCTWGTILKNRFIECTQSLINRSFEQEIRDSPKFRDLNIRKSSRLSTFTRPTSSKTTSTSKELTSSSGQLVSSHLTDPDVSMMPPPPPVTPRQLPRISRTFYEPVDSTMAIHPLEAEQSITDSHMFDPIVACESPGRARLPEPEQIEGPENLVTLSINMEGESEQDNLIMKKEDFYQFIKQIWYTLARCTSVTNEEKFKFELGDILIDSSIQELIKYFCYICEYERLGELYVEQTISYGPIFIIKS